MSVHFTEAWRAVATAKIEAFADECWRLADLADKGAVDRGDAAATLQDIADANSLPETFGADYVAELISVGFSPPTAMEAAE
jgi:hypothetical protein